MCVCERFEELLVTHCAPTLAGHKCGSLFRWSGCSQALRAECLQEINETLAVKGLRVRSLSECENGCLIYVYRFKMLRERLSDRKVQEFLRTYGYGEPSPEKCLARLFERIVCEKDFPHEIGVFLDYPLGDVIGFIEHRGENYCCLGCWKAYVNAQEAQKRFALYMKCRDIYVDCYRRGFSVSRLTIAA